MSWPTAACVCAVCVMLGLACLATGSAAPLQGAAFVVFLVVMMIFVLLTL